MFGSAALPRMLQESDDSIKSKSNRNNRGDPVHFPECRHPLSSWAALCRQHWLGVCQPEASASLYHQVHVPFRQRAAGSSGEDHQPFGERIETLLQTEERSLLRLCWPEGKTSGDLVSVLFEWFLIIDLISLKWREEMNKYCSTQKGDQVDSHCCRGKTANDRYSCFQTSSPDPNYNRTSATEEIWFDKMCDIHSNMRR